LADDLDRESTQLPASECLLRIDARDPATAEISYGGNKQLV
jgi:hypothetical protein